MFHYTWKQSKQSIICNKNGLKLKTFMPMNKVRK